MIFSIAKKKKLSLSIKIEGREVEVTESFKYLGVKSDNKLTWKQHTMHIIYKRISKFSGLLYKLRNFANTKVLQLLYYGLVYPHLLHSITTWGNTYSTTLQPLQVIQNRILKCITNAKLKQALTPFFKETNTLKAIDIYTLEVAKVYVQTQKITLIKTFQVSFCQCFRYSYP